ncbi:hypothetical protein RJ639_046478 [Escallonia herrerae]|uniref:Regulatory protein RecX n=1 Tax=Escallonia herrerae TaxID=1293975 RepID=A0AA88WFI7_9ASTE|nr:hypothetical protein RJ639_046478 [Escallonia herrerae]
MALYAEGIFTTTKSSMRLACVGGVPIATGSAIIPSVATGLAEFFLLERLLTKCFWKRSDNWLNEWMDLGCIDLNHACAAFLRVVGKALHMTASETWRSSIACTFRGVTKVDSEKAINLVFQDGESGGDQESRLGLSKLSMDHLLVQASKQRQRGRDVPSDKRKLRILRWLQYRGFDWHVVSFVLKKLESQNPP